MMKFLFITVVLHYLTLGFLLAQSRTVSGTVTDTETNEPLPGVNILVKGTGTGTITDADGNFNVQVLSEDAVLVFSSIGYLSEEITVGSQSTIDMVLFPDIKSLSEIVVIGYGERERKDLTGAISQIGSEEITQSVAMTPELAMQGRLPGVFVSTPGGEPNARPVVRIRGVGTFGNAEPLYVVDGVPITEFGQGAEGGIVADIRGNVNIFTLINPNDIASISVLKDASAAAIYGVRAANGVVLITTKKGQAGEPRVSINASRGVQNIPNTFDVLNTTQYTQLYQEAFANNPDEAPNIPAEFNPNGQRYLGDNPTFDWQGELLNRNAITEDYSLRLSGGTEKTTYYLSGGYARTESPLKGNELKRYSLTLNVNSEFMDIFDVGVNYKFAFVDAIDNSRANLQEMATAPPWQPIYDANGPLGLGFAPVRNAFGEDFLYGPETESNPFARQQLSLTDYQVIRNLGNAFVQVEPLEGLRLKGALSIDWYYNQRNDFTNANEVFFSPTAQDPTTFGNGTSAGLYRERHDRNFNLVKEFSINYNKSFGDHNIDILLNAMDQEYSFNTATGQSDQVLSSDPAVRGISGDFPQFTRAISFREPNALQGYLGRLSYNYASKYYVDATVRRDGTSRFSPDFRWGTFPSFAAAWRISAEDFMQNMGFINDLKLRGGWGQLGNQETRAFAFLSTVQTQPTYALGSGNG
ncbi:MAG: SusC/RagA family TonB-linked outer membrane protein, partial [Bacteroidota bacterium]